MESIKISIITASFNSEKTIKETIESILAQSYANLEYIIIDGGSIDKTVSIIKSYESKFDNRLKWISEKDNGIYDAWNKGLKMVTGDWVSFLGSDDIYMPNAISDYIELIENNDKSINFVSSKLELVNSLEEQEVVIGKPWSKLVKCYNCLAHPGALHNISLFQDFGEFNTKYKIAGDYEFLLRNFDKINALFMDRVTVKMGAGGISHTLVYKCGREVLEITNTLLQNRRIVNYFIFLKGMLGYFIRKIKV